MGFLDKIFTKNKTDRADSKKSSMSNNTIYVNDSFSYFGNGKCGRQLEELDKINIQEADESFRKCKKDILDVFMKEHDFIKYKTNAYIRLNSIGLLEYIDLQKESHGSKTFTLNVCVLPIYVPHKVFTIGFGDRISVLINGKDFWWDYKDLCTSEKSFENIIQALELFIFPWFEQYNSADKYQKDLFDDVGTIGNSRIKWITYLYIKNNELEKAKDYLDKYLNSDNFDNAVEIRKNKISETVNDYEQSNRIHAYIKNEFECSCEFLWERYPNYVVYRNKKNKWFSILMDIQMNKIEKNNDDTIIEILNVKIDPNRKNDLLKLDGIYEAYHMNKKIGFL